MVDIRNLITRVVAYWRPFRAALLVVAAAGFAIGVAVDQAAVAVVAVLVGLGALAVLVSFVGSRVDHQHELLGPIASAVKERQRSLGTASERDLFRRSRGGLGVSVLVPVQPKTDPAKLLRHLSDQMPAAEIVLIDRTGTAAVRHALAALGELAPDLVYVASHASHDVIDDLNQAREIVTGRHLVVVPRTFGLADVADVAGLVASAPGADEPWIAVRRSPTRSDLSLFSASALREVGGWVDSVNVDSLLVERLVEAGYIVDGGPGSRGSTRVGHGLDLSQLHATEPHALTGGIGLVVDDPDAASFLPAVVEGLLAANVRFIIFVDEQRWPDLRPELVALPAPMLALPTAGEWLETVRAMVEVTGEGGRPHQALTTFAAYGAPSYLLRPADREAALLTTLNSVPEESLSVPVETAISRILSA